MEQKNPPEGAKDGLHKVGEIVEVVEEGDLLEIVEIEVYAKEGKPLPRAKKYKFRIDREHFTVDHHIISGEELFRLRKSRRKNGGCMKNCTAATCARSRLATRSICTNNALSDS